MAILKQIKVCRNRNIKNQALRCFVWVENNYLVVKYSAQIEKHQA